MSRNYTNQFIQLVDKVLLQESTFFKKLDEDFKRIKSYPHLQKCVLEHYKLIYETNQNNAKEIFTKHIKMFIEENKNNFSMNTNILHNIAKQLHIDYLLNDSINEKYTIYHSLATTLNYYGIFKEDKIVDLSNTSFWTELIKKFYLLYVISPNGFRSDIKKSYDTEIPNLVNALKYFKNTFKININCIDNEIQLKKSQENKIITLLEKKLKQIDIFDFLDFIFIQNRTNKSIPFNYIINLAIKNINGCSFKKKNENKYKTIIELVIQFINLYQLRSFNMWEYAFIDEQNISKILKKQTLHASLYLLDYPLKSSTVVKYINNLLGDEIINKDFETKFGFSKKDLNQFLQNAESLSKQSNIIQIDITISNEIEQIIKFFSIDSKKINKNYSNPIDLSNTENLFIHNPIIKYKDTYYLIGYKYFKLNFYKALVERIRLTTTPNINSKIGHNIDDYVEKIFKSKNHDIYSGKYKISKNNIPECDLVIKLNDKIVFIENKNKALTKNSYSGSSVHILQDFIRAFATSQFQLLRHEKNLLENKELKFLDGKTLTYNKEQIVKISLSPNNWYSIMNNTPSKMIHALIRMRFTFSSDTPQDIRNDFEKTNKDLDKLTDLIVELEKDHDINNLIFSSLFIPLELISDNDSDEKLIDYIIGLVFMKSNAPNIYDAYSNYKRIKTS